MKKNKPENGYRKPNNCPYCDYFCDAATMTSKEKNKDPNKIAPTVGDLSFCLMCSGSSYFDDNMKLKIFDLNSIKDLVERNRLKTIQVKMEMFWECNPDKTGKREHHLKIRDVRGL